MDIKEAPLPIRLLQKDVIERELSPIYACTTIEHNDTVIGGVYRNAMEGIIAKKRTTVFSYLDGMSIHGDDLLDAEKIQVLKQLAMKFQDKKIAFSSCYIDILGEKIVNLGFYFDSEEELKRLTEEFEGDIRFSFIADLQADGKYSVRNSEESRCAGHFTNTPHLKGDMLAEPEETE